MFAETRRKDGRESRSASPVESPQLRATEKFSERHDHLKKSTSTRAGDAGSPSARLLHLAPDPRQATLLAMITLIGPAYSPEESVPPYKPARVEGGYTIASSRKKNSCADRRHHPAEGKSSAVSGPRRWGPARSETAASSRPARPSERNTNRRIKHREIFPAPSPPSSPKTGSGLINPSVPVYEPGGIPVSPKSATKFPAPTHVDGTRPPANRYPRSHPRYSR